MGNPCKGTDEIPLNRSTTVEKFRLILEILLFLSMAPGAWADFTSLTGAETAPNILEIRINGDRLSLSLEVSALDAKYFWPEISVTDKLSTLSANANRRPQFGFKVLAEGTPLPIAHYRVNVADRKLRNSPFAGQTDPRTGRRLPALPQDRNILRVDADYVLNGSREITLIPPLDSQGQTASTIGFITHHGNMPVNNFAYLSRAETLLIDRDDPWRTRLENTNIRRHLRFPLLSFLYVEPRQVRHEIVLRPRDLARWANQPFHAWEMLTPDKQRDLSTTTRDYLREKNPTKIDRRPRTPGATEVVFLKATDNGLLPVTKEEPIELGALLIGYRERYPQTTLPQRVDIQWRLFSDLEPNVPSLVQDPAGPFPTQVTATLPDIQWQNFLTRYQEPIPTGVIVSQNGLPIAPRLITAIAVVVLLLLTAIYVRRRRWQLRTLALAVVGLSGTLLVAQLPIEKIAIPMPASFSRGKTEQEITRAIGELLSQLSLAYYEQAPEKRQQALALLISDTDLTATTTALTPLYRPPTATGDRGRVVAIEQLQLEHFEPAEIAGQPGFRTICNWRASIEGHFWGHSDRRQYQVRAMLDIVREDGQWRIAAFTPLSLRQ